MFKDETDFEKIVNRLKIDTEPNPKHRENLHRKILAALEEEQPAMRTIVLRTLRSIIMKSPITKLAAAAVIIIVMGIFLYTNNNIVPTAYALQDTIDAYTSIRSLHIKTSRMVGGENRTTDTWLEFDMHGNINKVRFNTPNCGEPVGSLTIVGGIGYGEAWLARHNLYIVGYNNPSCILGFDVSQIEPKGLVERFSQQEAQGELILDVNVPLQKDEPILVTVTYPQGSLSQNWKKVLYIDQATSLVKKIEKFEFTEGKFQLKQSTEFFDYNQEFDPAMFSLEGEIPADTLVFDVTNVEAGLLQGDMTDEEAATEIVRQFFEAAVAKDFTRAGQLFLAAPDFLVEQAFMGANLLEIISVGPAEPVTDPDSEAFLCSCKMLVEFEGQYYELGVAMKAEQISTEPEPRCWLMTGFISMSIGPASGDVTISKTGANLDAVTYDNPKRGEFMKKWLVLDPIWIEVRGDTLFPVEETQKDYFETEQINTAQFEPSVTLNGKNHKWSLLESKYGTIDCTSVNENWYLVTYLYSQIDMPEEKQWTLGIGSDDSVKVWLNGELVHENWVTRGVGIDNDRVPVTLQKGINQIMIKIQNRGGPWGFCCRLLDE
jgi:hypothetical protein